MLLLDAYEKSAFADTSDLPLIFLPDACPEWQKPEILKLFLADLKKQFDVIIVRNRSLDRDASALLLMASAGFNLFVLDSRNTQLKKVAELDLLKLEMGMDNINIAINRNEYTPSVWRSIEYRLRSKKRKTLV